MTRELSLQPRLALLASLVPQGAVLADVGTDHGYIPVCLRQRGVIDRAIASDIGREPLEHARRTAEEYGVGGIDLRLCAGLDAIAPEECDTVLIAGMGGEPIWGILAAAPGPRGGRRPRPCARARGARRGLSRPSDHASAPPGRGPAAVGQRRSGRLCRAGGRAGSKEREVGT